MWNHSIYPHWWFHALKSPGIQLMIKRCWGFFRKKSFYTFICGLPKHVSLFKEVDCICNMIPPFKAVDQQISSSFLNFYNTYMVLCSVIVCIHYILNKNLFGLCLYVIYNVLKTSNANLVCVLLFLRFLFGTGKVG